nr:unnamed protein product [Callosobruchus analis]CAI5854565.1 unnamed protein product [Callosobruchus analis]
MGDFNISNYVYGRTSDRLTHIFAEFLEFTNLSQINFTHNSIGRLLDLVVTDVHCETTHDDVPLVVENMYHPSLSITCYTKSNHDNSFKANSLQNSYNFRKANFIGLYNALTYINWSFLTETNDVNIMCDLFYNMLYHTLNMYVPKYTKYKRSYPKWYTAEIIRNIKRKHSLHRTFVRTKRSEDYVELSNLRPLVKQQIASSFDAYIQRIQDELIGDSSRFWSFINMKNNASRIPSRMTYNNTTLDTPNSIVDSFVDFFQSFYTADNYQTLACDVQQTCNINVSEISEDCILKSLLKLPNKFTAGEDMIPSFFVKDAAHVFKKPLSSIFSCALKTGIFPDK